MSVCRSKRATSDSSAGLVPSSSSAAGRSSVIRLRRSPIAVVICSSAPSIAPVMRVASPLRRAPDEQHAQAGELLQRLVVQLARPARAFGLGGLDRALERLLARVLGGRDGGRRAGRERLQQPLVLLVERAVAVEAVDHRERADGAVAEDHRRDDPVALVARVLPGLRGEHVLVALAQGDLGRARVDQRPRALDDQLQHAVEVGHAAERAADLGRGLQAAHRAFELVAALADGAVQARVADRDRGPVGEHDRRLLVLVRELARRLLGQVEVAPGLAVDDQRHAEERRHRRVREREAERLRVRADVGEPQRPGVGDQHAEHAAPARQVADRAVRVGVDAGGQEALELLTALVEHADRGVPSARELARDFQQPLEDRLGVELGDERPADVHQPPQTVLIHGAGAGYPVFTRSCRAPVTRPGGRAVASSGAR